MRDIAELLSGDVSGTPCLIRVDYNCPIDGGRITDTTRIDRTVDGLKALLEAGAKLRLCSHLGRPKGQIKPEYSLLPVAEYLSSRLGFAVPLLSPDAPEADTGSDASVIMLENLRFFAGEEANEAAFAAMLARFGDVYINDAFSCAHRAHASTHAVAALLPAYAGALLSAEVTALNRVLDAPVRPVVAVVGGAKVSTKLAVLNHLVDKTDHILLGGGMANTFALARGYEMGASLAEPEMLEIVREIEATASTSGCTIHLPIDGIVAEQFAANAPSRQVMLSDGLSDAEMMLDIGAQTLASFGQVIDKANTVLWNGPMGAFELAGFDQGTYQLARHVAAKSKGGLTSVAGGGDTVAALNGAGVAEEFSYVSLAGGAFLEWIEGKILPGIAALEA
ncbi:MAG: phosphoglycerate kinase [Candidatus Puniceispirillaceae bacterium]